MLWFLYAVLGAVTISIAGIISKKELFKKHALEFATLKTMFMGIMALVLLFFIRPNVKFSIVILIYLISLGGTLAILLRTKALRHLDLSTFSPLNNISPLFLVVFAFILLGERLEGIQLFGIFLIIAGAYTLEVDHKYKNFFDPFKRMLKKRYHFLLLITLIIVSLLAVADKYMITNHIDAMAYVCYIWIFIGFNFIVIDFFMFRLKDVKADLRKNVFPIIGVGLFTFLSSIFTVLAFSLQIASLVIPVKRLATLFDTMIGGSMFHEKGIKLKIIACLIMILGTYFLSL